MRVRRLVAGALLAVLGLLTAFGSASPLLAQSDEPVGTTSESETRVRGTLDVVELDGPVDAINRDFLLRALERAETDPTVVATFLRINTPGALGVDVDELAQAVRDAPKPVIAWVANPGSRAQARGVGLMIAAAADLVGVAPGSVLGPLNPPDMIDGTELTEAEAAALFAELVPPNRKPDAYLPAVDAAISSQEAARLGATDFSATYLGEATVSIDGKSVVDDRGKVARLDTVETRRTPPEAGGDAAPGGGTQLVPVLVTRFWKLAGIEGFLHKINTPTFAYTLLVIGLATIAFEFFAASIGIAGAIGGVCTLLGFQAAGALPVNWWAVVLLALAVVLLSIDVQQSHLGGFTVLGTVAALAGSIWFTSTPFYTVRWWAIVLVVGGLVAFYAIAMTTVVRTRFATPTIGREHLVGAAGTVVERCDPDGFVDIDGAVWKARAHRGRISEGEPVTVRSVNGLLLEIDPEAPVSATETVDAPG